jgi:hypothetical protein
MADGWGGGGGFGGSSLPGQELLRHTEAEMRDPDEPNVGSTWSQAEYAERTDEDVRAGKKPLLARIWVAVRRSIWGE